MYQSTPTETVHSEECPIHGNHSPSGLTNYHGHALVCSRVPEITIATGTPVAQLVSQLELQAKGAPIVRATFENAPENPFWLILGYRAAREALSANNRHIFCSRRSLDRPRDRADAQALTFGDLSDRSLIFMDNKYHPLLRNFLVSRLAKGTRTAGYYTELITRKIEQTLAEAQSIAGQSQGQADIVSTIARHIPVRVVCEMLGISEVVGPNAIHGLTEQDLVKLSLDVALGFDVPPTRERVAHAARAFQRLYAFMRDCYAHKSFAPGSLMDESAQYIQTLDTNEYPEVANYVLANAAMMVFAGHETTSTFLGSAFALAFEHQEIVREITQGGPTGWREFVEEALRVAPPTTALHRTIGEDTHFYGAQMKRGDGAAVLLMAANRDPEVFADPNRFHPQRYADRGQPMPISFGSGPHTCVGNYLAKLESELTLEALFTRWPGIQQCLPVPDPICAFSYHGYHTLHATLS
jgi:cytochrome P450